MFEAAGSTPGQAEKLTDQFYRQVLLEAYGFLSRLHDRFENVDFESLSSSQLEEKLAGFDAEEATAAVAQAGMSLCYGWLGQISAYLDDNQLDQITRLIEDFGEEATSE